MTRYTREGNGQRAFLGPAAETKPLPTPTKDDEIIGFGRYKGQYTFRDLLQVAPDYLIWIWEKHSNGKNLITETLADSAYYIVRKG